MLATLWQKIAWAVENIAKSVDAPHNEKVTAITSRRIDIPQLKLPQRPNIQTILVCNGLPDRLISSCETCFNQTVDQIEECLQAQFEATVLRVCLQNPYDAQSHTGYVQSLQRNLVFVYSNSLEKLVNTMRARFSNSHDFSASPFASSSRATTPSETSHCQEHLAFESSKARKGRPHLFTKEQTKVLQALLAHDDQFSHEEKELIAQTLDLTREQVNRWVSLLLVVYHKTIRTNHQVCLVHSVL